MSMRSWWINIPGPSGKDNSVVYVLYSFPEFPTKIQPQLPTVLICLMAHLVLASSPSSITSNWCPVLLIFPSYSLQISCFQSLPLRNFIKSVRMIQISNGREPDEPNFSGEHQWVRACLEGIIGGDAMYRQDSPVRPGSSGEGKHECTLNPTCQAEARI